MDIIDKFSNHLKNVLLSAFSLAEKRQDDFIDPEHILYCLSKENGCLGKEILSNFSIKPSDFKEYLSLPKEISENKKQSPKISEETKILIEKMLVTARIFEHKFVGTEHLIAAFMQMDKSVLINLLLRKNIPVKDLNTQIKNILKSSSKFSDIVSAYSNYSLNREKNDNFGPQMGMAEESMPFPPAFPQGSPKDFIKQFTVDLTAKAVSEKIDPVIGRENEIERLTQILSRKTKNNPILLGDAGVGKTAIVEGLAKRIYLKKTPDILLKKKILSLDLGSLIAGTIYRGEFEARLKQIIDAIKNDDNIILFIDEIHNIMGAGSSSGTLDAANILKPALARGEIRCIGATTLDEFKQHIEKDPALERRFQPIIVYEPSLENTKKILLGIKENYEKFHSVTITEEAINAAVLLSEKYISDKFQPDKSIDLIDEAAAKTKIKNNSKKQNHILFEIENRIKKAISLKEKAVIDENFELALKLKQQETELVSMYEKEKQVLDSQKEKDFPKLLKEDIYEIISRITNIPFEKLSLNEKQKILNLENNLNKKIIGQKHITSEVANQLTRAFANINNPNQPLASFLFLGPSGSGKTELAKTLAYELFENKDSLIRIDMSEFSESFNISKLIGSPAGYVGYRESNKFTDLVKKRPHSLILLDEIEKAHPKVISLLLQILDEGFITDAIGRKINFKNTVIVMTSNIGIKDFNHAAQIGFNTSANSNNDFRELKNKALEDLKKHFSLEFINRINKILVFNYLTQNDLKQILKLNIKNLNTRLLEKEIILNLNNQALEHLAKLSKEQNQGGRAIKNIIEQQIESPLAIEILKNNITSKSKLELYLKNEKLFFKTSSKKQNEKRANIAAK